MPTPSASGSIARKYGVGSLDQKVQNKTALQESLGWPSEPKRPVLCFPAGMTDALGGALLQDVLPGILSLPVEVLVLGRGSSTYGALFTKLAKENRHRLHIVTDKEDDVQTMYAAADMALFLSNTLPAKEIAQCLQYGVIPVSPAQNLLEDYDPVQEAGNAFIYGPVGKWQCFAALVRACETHKFPFDWRTIQRHAMESVREK